MCFSSSCVICGILFPCILTRDQNLLSNIPMLWFLFLSFFTVTFCESLLTPSAFDVLVSILRPFVLIYQSPCSIPLLFIVRFISWLCLLKCPHFLWTLWMISLYPCFPSCVYFLCAGFASTVVVFSCFSLVSCLLWARRNSTSSWCAWESSLSPRVVPHGGERDGLQKEFLCRC